MKHTNWAFVVSGLMIAENFVGGRPYERFRNTLLKNRDQEAILERSSRLVRGLSALGKREYAECRCSATARVFS